jgi:hypothetical protein
MIDALRTEEVLRHSLISPAEKHHIGATVNIPMTALPHFLWDRTVFVHQASNVHRHWKLKERSF